MSSGPWSSKSDTRWFRFCYSILSSLLAKICQSCQSLLIADWVHGRILTSTFRWLAQKKWYGKPVTCYLCLNFHILCRPRNVENELACILMAEKMCSCSEIKSFLPMTWFVMHFLCSFQTTLLQVTDNLPVSFSLFYRLRMSVLFGKSILSTNIPGPRSQIISTHEVIYGHTIMYPMT